MSASTCTCLSLVLGPEVLTGHRNWSDRCPAHGVGTDYFRALKTKPFGYQSEANTTRDEWLAYLESET